MIEALAKERLLQPGASAGNRETDIWFVDQVLPLEPLLVQLLRHWWGVENEIADLRQEIYVRVYNAARRELPNPVKPFLIAVARNLVLDRLRHRRVLAIETLPDLVWENISETTPSPEEQAAACQELQRMHSALDLLPQRCRQVVVLRRVQSLSQREVARRMGIGECMVERQLAKGMRILANVLSGIRGPRDLPAAAEPRPETAACKNIATDVRK
jgi:RNA polymerase sigma-70 factor (ECF subfamily)